MAFVPDGLISASSPLAVLYLCLSGYITRRLLALQTLSSTHYLNPSKLFVLSCLLSSILRCMSFASMTVLDIMEIEYNSTDSDSSQDRLGRRSLSLTSSSSVINKPVPTFDDTVNGTEDTFEKALVVLFDFPDFCFISAYALILVVWAETSLESRKHWLSSMEFKRIWVLSYLIFNIVLYTTQTGLYSMLFVSSVNKELLSDAIYLALTVFNLGVPLTALFAHLYLSVRFSGFPYTSAYSKHRLQKLASVVTLWTATRLVWGLVTLTTWLHGWISAIQQTAWSNTIFMMVLFLTTEILPVMFSLRNDVLGSTLLERRPSSDGSFQQELEADDYTTTSSRRFCNYCCPSRNQENETTAVAHNESGLKLRNAAPGYGSTGEIIRTQQALPACGTLLSSSNRKRNSSSASGGGSFQSLQHSADLDEYRQSASKNISDISSGSDSYTSARSENSFSPAPSPNRKLYEDLKQPENCQTHCTQNESPEAEEALSPNSGNTTHHQPSSWAFWV